MRTRNHDWFDTEAMVMYYGYQVKCGKDGRWKNVTRNGIPELFHCPRDRDIARGFARKLKEQTDD